MYTGVWLGGAWKEGDGVCSKIDSSLVSCWGGMHQRGTASFERLRSLSLRLAWLIPREDDALALVLAPPRERFFLLVKTVSSSSKPWRHNSVVRREISLTDHASRVAVHAGWCRKRARGAHLCDNHREGVFIQIPGSHYQAHSEK